MESHSTNEKTQDKTDQPINPAKRVTVRGSGFTYTENEERTDKSIPVPQAEDEEIVPLPDLGQKNRP
jgi:hypothetical protein